jgi:hypothetical protein
VQNLLWVSTDPVSVSRTVDDVRRCGATLRRAFLIRSFGRIVAADAAPHRDGPVLRRLLLVPLAVLAWLAVAPGPAYADDSTSAVSLAQRYSPVVVVREHATPCGAGEPYLPTPVTTLLGRAEVVLRGPDGQKIVAPTAADLAGKGDGWYLDQPGNPLSPGCDYERQFTTIASGTPASVYSRVATDPDHPGQLALQYWFFWTFNDWNDKHEGDWEMVQLLFDARSPDEALGITPSSTAFAQHEGSETAAWSDPKVHKDGDHVVVYPGAGSHAAYYTQAQWFGKSAAAGFGCDDTRAPGTLVRPDVVPLPDNADGDFAWLSYTGRWGQQAPSFNNGPTGPNTKTQWAHPVSWQLDQGRDSAVALPTVGGPSVTTFCNLTRAGSLLFVQALDNPGVVVLGVVAVLALLVLLIARTDWRTSGTELDQERKAGQIAFAAFGVVRRRLPALWLPTAIVAVATASTLGLQRFLLRAHPGDDLTDVDGFAHNGLGIGGALAAQVLLLPVIAFAMAACVEIVDGIARHDEIDGRTAIRRVLAHPGGWLAALSVYLVVAGLAVSFWLLPVGLYLMARWGVALPATALEDRGVRNGLRTSARLTKGRRVRTALMLLFLVWLGFALPNGVGAVLLLLTGWPFWVTNVVSIVLSALLVTVAAVGLTLLYYDLRRRAADSTSAAPQPVVSGSPGV